MKQSAESQQNTMELFGQALALQQQKNWDESLLAYQKLIDLGPAALGPNQASVVYHNMSLIASEKADFLKAYVWSKKAHFLNPLHRQAKESYQHFQTNFQVPSIPHQISGLQQAEQLVAKIPLDAWLTMTLIFLLSFFFLFAKKAVETTQNKAKGLFQKVRYWPVFMLLAFSCAFALLSWVRLSSASAVQAIVIAEKAAIQTVAGENKPVIYEAPAGLELDVLNEDGDYYQVRYVGAFSGWVQKKQIELLSLEFKQK